MRRQNYWYGERSSENWERSAHISWCYCPKKSITAWVDNRFNEGIHFHVYILKNWMKSFIDLNTVMRVLCSFTSLSHRSGWLRLLLSSCTFRKIFTLFYRTSCKISLLWRDANSITSFSFIFYSFKKFHNVHMYVPKKKLNMIVDKKFISLAYK